MQAYYATVKFCRMYVDLKALDIFTLFLFASFLFLSYQTCQGKFREDNFQQAMGKLQGIGGGGRSRKGGPKGSSCYMVVKMIMERKLQPVIVFSFSRRDCEAYALQISKLDFLSRKAWARVGGVGVQDRLLPGGGVRLQYRCNRTSVVYTC